MRNDEALATNQERIAPTVSVTKWSDSGVRKAELSGDAGIVGHNPPACAPNAGPMRTRRDI